MLDFKAGSHIIAAIVSIAAVNSKSGLTIGTIIWEHYISDRLCLRRLGRPRSLGLPVFHPGDWSQTRAIEAIAAIIWEPAFTFVTRLILKSERRRRYWKCSKCKLKYIYSTLYGFPLKKTKQTKKNTRRSVIVKQSHIIVPIVSIAAVNSKSGLTIGTIIWEHYISDRLCLRRLGRPQSLGSAVFYLGDLSQTGAIVNHFFCESYSGRWWKRS